MTKTVKQLEDIIMMRFKKTNSEVGHVLNIMAFRHTVVVNLNPEEKKRLSEAFRKLLDKKFISVKKTGVGEDYALSQEGYDYIYF